MQAAEEAGSPDALDAKQAHSEYTRGPQHQALGRTLSSVRQPYSLDLTEHTLSLRCLFDPTAFGPVIAGLSGGSQVRRKNESLN